MKNFCFLAGSLAISTCAMGADFGLGVGFGQDAGTIYAPIDMTVGLRVEPYISAQRQSGTSTLPSSSSTSSARYGVGVFATRRATESINVFAGSRFAYAKRKLTDSSSGTNNSMNTSGYVVAPTIGFEYFFQKNISIGAEAAVSYSRITGRNTYGSGTDLDTKEISTATSTAVTIKYYFN